MCSAALLTVVLLVLQVEFSADSMRLSLIEMARTGQKLISVVGHVDFQCQEVGAGEPVSFTTPESFLVSCKTSRAELRFPNPPSVEEP